MENYIKFQPSKQPLYKEPNKDYLYLFKEDMIMVVDKDNRLSIPTREIIENLEIKASKIQCLGAYDGIDCYCGEIEGIINVEDCKLVNLRTLSNHGNYDDFLVSAKALLLLDFIRSNQRCGVCGSPTLIKEGGDDRAILCTSCDHIVWPKTAPAIIVAVTKGDKLLLAHNSMFPQGMYSVLAGFVEMGETFEQCVKREVFEETGIMVGNIKYFGSQPWPFPNSYMIGFTAEYLEGEIKVDQNEILDAKWFTREEIPGKYRQSISISTELIEWFMNGASR